jgi:hypothetical protein
MAAKDFKITNITRGEAFMLTAVLVQLTLKKQNINTLCFNFML